MQSSNPAFSTKRFKQLASSVESTETMSVNGSISKTAIALAITVFSAAVTWNTVSSNTSLALPLVLGGSIAALVLALVITFKKPSGILVALYAALEGVVLGTISLLFSAAYTGIVLQAIVLTLSVTAGMLALYTSGLVKVTEKLRSVIIIATVGVLLYYLVTIVIGLISPAFTEALASSTLGLVFAGVIVVIAALNLLLDFDFIEKGSKGGLPKQFEWYAAFGLLVTLVWLYMSILRMLASSRN
jgi:uncharacterized YccA/Bax inhibitor family protein